MIVSAMGSFVDNKAEFGASSKLPFVFRARMSPCHIYVRPDDYICLPDDYGVSVLPQLLRFNGPGVSFSKMSRLPPGPGSSYAGLHTQSPYY